MRPIDFTPTSATAQVANALWAHWANAAEPIQTTTSRPSKPAASHLLAWSVKPDTGHAYALAAAERYCNQRGLTVPPPNTWEWLLCPREMSRCARLKNGGLRIATPEPSNIVGVMLLVHELCHASLEWHSPSSLADTERTETFAMAGELFAQHWLLSPVCPEHSSPLLAQALASWRQEREHEFNTHHAALARFEWLLWTSAQSCRAPVCVQTYIETVWQLAYAEFGLVGRPTSWAVHPLITRKPGCAGAYLKIWRMVSNEVLHAA